MTSNDYGDGTETVLTALDRVIARNADAVALRGADGTAVSYGELGERAQQLADRLAGLGVESGALVGQCIERSPALVIASVGILKAACAYVAIDPKYPDERIDWMLADSHAAAAVTDTATAARVGAASGRIVVLSAAGELIDPGHGGASVPRPRRLASDLAYVVYTSGSTGLPKGAMVEHGGLMNLAAWHCREFSMGAEDHSTQIASPGFDASVWEIWAALAAGATIHVVPDALRTDPTALRDWLVDREITISFLPTAVAEAVIGLQWPSGTRLRHLLTGGDALTRRPPAGLPFALVNNYGLSETAVVATSGLVAADAIGTPTIGRAIDGVTLEVVDEDLRLLPPGVEGELVVGGIAVARGYLGRPELTADRFLLDERGQRRYRTGDLVRLREDGEIEFLGRLDDQLSIRGFRVEPGEVAAALSAHPDIAASAAIGVGDSAASRRLVAYAVAQDTVRPTDDELDTFLRGVLPEHMVPSGYVWLEELPLTEHGKLDRDALPEPASDAQPVGRLPESEIETAIAVIVAELLGADQIYSDQNFFLLGGHSMLGAQLITRLEDLYGVEVSLRYLFDNPTLTAIAEEVERQLAGALDGAAVAG
ncbi:MAG TPA: non-ribosomal peptide synthetase [Solirubrobacteraceae bacterium]|jgi:amino acid adenylation domain-containing protein